MSPSGDIEGANPGRRHWRGKGKGIAVAITGLVITFLWMANHQQVPHGALYGALSLLVCVGGTLRALGLLPRADGSITAPASLAGWHALPGEPAWLAPRVVLPVALLVVAATAKLLGGAWLPGTLVLALLALGPASLRRPGLFVFVLASLLVLPLLGAYGLWDPWETHYGEVAREILSRDDWISLWWAQDKWFWSKPIFIFWAEALVWSASGIDFRPDTNFDHAEWVLRLPTYAIAVAALLAVYSLVARVFGRRAGVLSAIVLCTTPYYGLLSRQAITDMPFVGLMTIAMMLLLHAVHTDPEHEVTSRRVGRWSLSLREVVLGAFLMLVIPQVLYLVSRNVTFVGGLFAWHRDEFLFGSAYNPDVPGNFGLRDQQPWARALWLQPMAQAIVWLVCAAGVVAMFRRERRTQAFLMLAFYLACALAFMAKGIPGFALPGLVAFLFLAGCGRWSLLFEGRLRVAAGALALVTVSLPWFVAMYVRHGPAFTDRILIHDHINRLTQGVHGDKGSIAYFLGEFGYGIFPWVALAPVALGSWLMLRGDSAEQSAHVGEASEHGGEDSARSPAARARWETLVAMGLWFAATFTLFSAMTTKFHHYVFPAVPPAAVLIGVLLDRMLGDSRVAAPGGRGVPTLAPVLAWIAPVPLVLGVAGYWGDVRGIVPDGLPTAVRAGWGPSHAWSPFVCGSLVALGLLCLALSAVLYARRRALLDPSRSPRAGEALLVASALCGAVVCAFVGRDLSWTTAARPAGHERLVQLFIYNYDRPFPNHLDYRPVFTGFAIVCSALVFATAWRLTRPVFTHAFVAAAVLFSAWTLNVYMIDLTPHWSQRDLVKRYYRERKKPSEAFVAWQMNWKGENFYTGNRVAVFVDLDNKKVKEWLEKRPGERVFAVLEHKRLDRFKGLVGKRAVKALTGERDNNKFVLVEVGR